MHARIGPFLRSDGQFKITGAVVLVELIGEPLLALGRKSTWNRVFEADDICSWEDNTK